MLTKIILLIVILSCSAIPKATAQQNLVKNPSFEEIDSCPTSAINVNDARYWTCLDSSHSESLNYLKDCEPDYANTCSPNGFGVPNHPFFYHYARTGNGLMGLIMYSNYVGSGADRQRTYLQGRLTTMLTAGQSYCVTFYTCLSNLSPFANNHIGAYLDNGSIDTASDCTLPQTKYIPQILDTAIIYDTLAWTRIQGNFTANGTERLITIGNFSDSNHTAHVRMLPGYVGYYLIDDVSVIASTASAYAGPDVTIQPGDTTYIGLDSNGEGIPCYWYALGGTTPIDSGGRIAVHPMDSATYIVSLDLCGNVTYDTVHVWVNTLSMKNVQIQNVQIFPNPVKNELVVTSGERIRDVVVTDVMGRVVLAKTCDAEYVVVHVNNLLPGVYFVRVNGVVRRFVKE